MIETIQETRPGVVAALEELVTALWATRIEEMASLFGVSPEEVARRQAEQLVSTAAMRQVGPDVCRQIEFVLERASLSSAA